MTRYSGWTPSISGNSERSSNRLQPPPGGYPDRTEPLYIGAGGDSINKISRRASGKRPPAVGGGERMRHHGLPPRRRSRRGRESGLDLLLVRLSLVPGRSGGVAPVASFRHGPGLRRSRRGDD